MTPLGPDDDERAWDRGMFMLAVLAVFLLGCALRMART